MKKTLRLVVFFAICLVTISLALGQSPEGAMSFTLSMEQPGTHNYHVVFRCEGLEGETQDFKMPAFSPGYYRIMNFARNVANFRADDEDSNPLEWEKTSENNWRVQSGKAASITISYDVYANRRSVADSYLDETRGYVSPTGVFMYIADKLRHPVTLEVKPYQGFSKISTGLEPVSGKPDTFSVPDFDVLYDCPILIGNQHIVSFDVKGIPYTIATVQDPNTFDSEKAIEVLKNMIETAVDVIGETPYRHYTFIMMGRGQGGLEHLNSMAVFSSIPNLDNPDSSASWLSFIAHEFFHSYNVKSIRPVALGPFDYDKENYTNMLWVSEGFTVYYQNMIINRAGFLPREKFLENLSSTIAKCENSPGHLLQSVTESSHNAWTQSFFGSENEVSYYDKGDILGALLDLKIRYETKNEKTLDDVMRTLYQQYYKEKKRGFTDEEFQHVCESVAGCPLPEIFEYASTVKEIDYPKYFAYAGLDIEMPKDKIEKGTFAIKPLQNPNPLQSEILKSWLKN